MIIVGHGPPESLALQWLAETPLVVVQQLDWPDPWAYRSADLILAPVSRVLSDSDAELAGPGPLVIALATDDPAPELRATIARHAHRYWLMQNAQHEDGIGFRREVEQALTAALECRWRGMWRLLREVTADLDRALDLAPILHEVLAQLVELTGGLRALAIVTQGAERQYLFACSDDPNAAGIPLGNKGSSAHEEVLRERRRVYSPMTQVTSRVALYDRGADTAACGVLLVPMLVEGEALGLIELHVPSQRGCSAYVIDLVESVAGLVAPRIRLSESYGQLREQTEPRALRALQSEHFNLLLLKYREFFDRAADGIVALDQDNRVLYLNPAGEELTGYAAHGIIGAPLANIVVGRELELLAERLALREGRGQPFDLSLVTTSGDPIIVSVTISGGIGDDELSVLSFRDVTEARVLSDELHQTNEFLARLIDSAVDAIIATDIAGEVVLFNSGAERIFGVSAADIVNNKTMAELFPEGVSETLLEQLRSPGEGGIGRLELVRKEILNSDGDLVPVRLSASVIYENGIEVGVVAIINDLRERLHIERRLLQAQEKLVETEKQALIAELAGSTAHELNQPLTSVMGYAELLCKRMPPDDPNYRACQLVMQECQRIAEIVNKIGKITRYETKAYVGGTQIIDLERSSE